MKRRRCLLVAKSIRHLEKRLDGIFVIALFEEHFAFHEAGTGCDLGVVCIGERAIGGERLVKLTKVLPRPGGGIAGLRGICGVGLAALELLGEREAPGPVSLAGGTLPGADQGQTAEVVRRELRRILEGGGEWPHGLGVIASLKE